MKSLFIYRCKLHTLILPNLHWWKSCVLNSPYIQLSLHLQIRSIFNFTVMKPFGFCDLCHKIWHSCTFSIWMCWTAWFTGFYWIWFFLKLLTLCICWWLVLPYYDWQGVLDGKYDDLPEQSFYMVGGIEEVIAKAEKIAKESAAWSEFLQHTQTFFFSYIFNNINDVAAATAACTQQICNF